MILLNKQFIMNNSKAIFHIEPIGFVVSPYKQKFGLARQSGLVPHAKIEIVLNETFAPDCVRGLEEYDYVWVQFVFHAALKEGWLPLIRPPKLGGRKKIGVFATRSPHRPNHLGLSLLKLENIRITGHRQIVLTLSGADLLDGTPVVDIKPYLAYVEAKPEARSSFAYNRPLLQVFWLPEAEQKLQEWQLGAEFKTLVEESLAQDPRPAHQHNKNKVFVMQLGNHDVLFEIAENEARVLNVRSHKE